MRKGDRLTVHPVLEPFAAGELDALSDSGRQKAVQNGIEQVVCQCPGCDVPTSQSQYSILRPSNFAFQLFEVEGLGRQERRGRAARDVVAGKGEEVQEKW